MQINYQIINFDYAKVIKTVEEITALSRHKMINAIIIGDFSCLRRNQFFAKQKGLATLIDFIFKHEMELFFQLPLITKESELQETQKLISDNWELFDGFISGDLGIIAFLDSLNKKYSLAKKLIYTTNVLNEEFSLYLKNNFNIAAIRPLFFKRAFIEEEIGFDKDVVIYGNMMINCATFCFHSQNDLVENCQFNCLKVKKMIMQKEVINLIGRSFITERKLDLLDRLNYIKNLKSVTIMDYDLTSANITQFLAEISEELCDI